MDSLIEDEFNQRQEDIDLVIDLIEQLSKGSSINVLEKKENNGEITKEIVSLHDYDSRLIATLSSVIYLMTYNQIESTMRGCLEALYDDISDSNISYALLRKEIQKEILDGLLKKYTTGNGLHEVVKDDFNHNAPPASLNIRKIFNGNVDTPKIHNIKDKYGVSIIAQSEHRNGMDITDFKNARNDLAHGNMSFSKYGNDNPYTETISKSKRVSGYLSVVIDSFNNYIDNKDYKV